MKVAIFLPILLNTAPAFCQSIPAAPVAPVAPSPYQLWQNPPSLTSPFGGLPLRGKAFTLTPRSLNVLPRAAAPRWGDAQIRAQIDPRIIAHPSKSALGDQPQGALVAQSEFPNLRVLPIQSGRQLKSPQPKDIPTEWPGPSVHEIPIRWPKFNLLPVDGGAAAATVPANPAGSRRTPGS